MQFTVETIVPNEYSVVDEVVANSYSKSDENYDGDEVDMVHRIRQSSKYRDDFEVVAKDENGQILGHALMIEVIVGSNAKPFKIASIIELSVRKDFRKQGIGQRILAELEVRARMANYPAVNAVDFSNFFIENGYIFAEDFNLHATMAIKMKRNFIKLLQDGGLYNRGGKIYYPAEFYGVRKARV
ncbi:GNAT family N-acetyltransferase [Lentilactobacillus sp. Marseille-Q4993]|uniref:GNAT family N-acetyltransferase n=1 Tax=Lentilactobacillus sp. Marseille-Q4993 TaxID=3039492 RepID=UPI0024BC6361|nr:GNAT family N-acetyltransferase [Lentilactobacillus sp. Marseille-Q4993]